MANRTLLTTQGGGRSRLYQFSGRFTSTVLTNIQNAAYDIISDTCSDDSNNVTGFWTLNQLVTFSGYNTWTVKSSASFSQKHASCSPDATDGTQNCVSTSHETDKTYYVSGQHTSTIKNSASISSFTGNGYGVSTDGVDTWQNDYVSKYFKFSGKVSATLKTSGTHPARNGNALGMSWDGSSTYVMDHIDEEAYRISGAFSSTVRQSLDYSAFTSGEVWGIGIDEAVGFRLPSPTGGAFPAWLRKPRINKSLLTR